MNYRSPQLYLTIIENISIFVAFYGLLKFYHAIQDELQWCNPWPKFLTIKGVVFLTFWQGLTISILYGIVSKDDRISSTTGSERNFSRMHRISSLLLRCSSHPLHILTYFRTKSGPPVRETMCSEIDNRATGCLFSNRPTSPWQDIFDGLSGWGSLEPFRPATLWGKSGTRGFQPKTAERKPGDMEFRLAM